MNYCSTDNPLFGPDMQNIENIIEQLKDKRGPLLPILHAIQEEVGYVPNDAVPVIAKKLNLSRAEVHGVISFYHDFKDAPRGNNLIQICRAEACQAMGSREIEKHAKSSLGLDYGETSADGSITLEQVYCLGNCARSPSVSLNNKVYARVTPESFDKLVADIVTDIATNDAAKQSAKEVKQ